MTSRMRKHYSEQDWNIMFTAEKNKQNGIQA